MSGRKMKNRDLYEVSFKLTNPGVSGDIKAWANSEEDAIQKVKAMIRNVDQITGVLLKGRA